MTTETTGRPDLSVIILSWNTKGDTRNSLQSILGYEHKYSIQTIVADNASEDGSREMVQIEFPDAMLVAHSNNLGFCGGNNAALPLATGRYVLFLNSDTIVKPGAFDAMIEFADTIPDLGILGPKLLNQDGSLQYSCRRFPNLGAGFFRNTPLGRLFPRNKFTSDYLMSDWAHDTVLDVDWVSGAALMIRRDALELVKGFDEGYYMFCEDVDICYQVHELGKRVLYFPFAEIFHIIGRSTDKVPTRMTYMFHRSMYRFYRKHYARKTPFYIKPLIIPGLIARASGQILRYRVRHIQRKLQNRSKK